MKESYVSKDEVLAIMKMMGFNIPEEIREEFYKTEIKGTKNKFEFVLSKIKG
jgi:hypothetical protein